MKKGMELPINMIVIIALAVLILVVITAFTTSQIGSGVSNIDVERAFAAACTQFRTQYNCADANIDEVTQKVQGLPEPQSLTLLCGRKGLNSPGECKAACGCLAQIPTAG